MNTASVQFLDTNGAASNISVVKTKQSLRLSQILPGPFCKNIGKAGGNRIEALRCYALSYDCLRWIVARLNQPVAIYLFCGPTAGGLHEGVCLSPVFVQYSLSINLYYLKLSAVLVIY